MLIEKWEEIGGVTTAESLAIWPGIIGIEEKQK